MALIEPSDGPPAVVRLAPMDRLRQLRVLRRPTLSWPLAMWAVSVAALALSVYNLTEAGKPADIRLVMAAQVRLTVGPSADVYLQPVFVSTATNDRAEVVDAVSATMTGPGAATPVMLDWYQTGAFDVGPTPDYVVDWKITNLRPEPIVITAASPQAPILRFHTDSSFT